MGASSIGRPLYIVDGYNVVFNGKFSKEGQDIESLREELVSYLNNYRSKKNVDIVVVWDGEAGNIGISSLHQAGHNPSGVKNLFSRKPENADAKIVKMVAKYERRGRITVVSNDRRHITGIVKNLGAKTMNVENFLSMIGYSKQKRSANSRATIDKSLDSGLDKLNADDLTVDEWLKMFKSKRKRGE